MIHCKREADPEEEYGGKSGYMETETEQKVDDDIGNRRVFCLLV